MLPKQPFVKGEMERRNNTHKKNYQGMKFVVSCGGAVVLEMGLAGKARTPFAVLLVTDPFTAVVVAAVVTAAGVEASELVL